MRRLNFGNLVATEYPNLKLVLSLLFVGCEEDIPMQSTVDVSLEPDAAELVDLPLKGGPINASVSPDGSQMYYVNSPDFPHFFPPVGNDDYDSANYYEEIWIYNFGTAEWMKYQELEKNQTVLCLSMGFSPSRKTIYWSGSNSELIVNSHTIEEAYDDVFCWGENM